MFKFLKSEIKIILIYLIAGLSWIYFSDKLLLSLIDNIELFNKIQTFKGLFYVIATALLLYSLIKKYLDDLREQQEEVKELNEELTAYNEELLAMNEELDQSLDEINDLNNKFISMINTVSELDNRRKLNEEEFFSKLLRQTITIVPEADYGKIYLIEDDECKFIDAIGHNSEKLKNIRLKKENVLKYNEKGVFILDSYLANLNNLSEDLKKEFLSAVKAIKSSLYINITIDDKVVGGISLDIAKESENEFSEASKKILRSFATLASSFFAFIRFDRLQGRFTKEFVTSIIKILEIHDVYTKGHSENVANISAKIAENMGLPQNIIIDAYWSGMVHDIGKLLISIDVLNKNGKLSDEEYDLIKKHPVWGSEALANSESLEHISQYILYHHERWDGKGYPEGLKKEEIPLISQILCVADAWDAMRSKRAYRDSLTKKEALDELKKYKGKQFSPEVIEAFLPLLADENIYNSWKYTNEINNDFFDKNYYQYLFNKSSEGIVILNNEFEVKKANENFLNMFNYKKSEVIDKHIKDIVVPEKKKMETDEFITAVKNGKKVDSKTTRKRKDGSSIEVSIQAFSISLDGPENKAYYVIYRDISEFKSVEKKYIDYKDNYKALFENDLSIMLIINPENGKIVDANPAAVKFYGWCREEMKKMKITDINVLDKEEVKKKMENAKNKKENIFQFKHRIASGEIKVVKVYSHAIHFGGKKYLYSIIKEI